MKVFITGGTGFIGRHLVRRMAQTGHALSCLARKTGDTRELADLGARIIIGDVGDRASLMEGMQGCDWVFNLANVYSWWEPDKKIYRRVNVEGTRNVMKCALESGVSKVVHVSTIAVYGKPKEFPIREETPVAPIRLCDYSQSKYEGEQIAWQLYREEDLPLVVVYPCMVLGSGDTKASGELIRLLINRRLPARVFDKTVVTAVHVNDVVETILKAAEKPDNLGEKYIVGNTRLSLDELYTLVSDVADVAPPKLRMPDSLVMLSARGLTWLAGKIKRPPLWGMSMDAMRLLKDGAAVDGSKVERELGIVYTSIRKAMEEEVAWRWQPSPGYIPARAMETEWELPRAWGGEERRIQTRSKVDIPCEVVGMSHGKQLYEKGQVIDISRQGMYVFASSPFDEGTEMKAQVKATRLSESFWVMGKVLRHTAKGMAIRFADYVPMEVEAILATR